MEGTLILGLGHRMRSGKDTAANAIISAYPEARRYGFADALKFEVFDALCNPKDEFWPWWYVNMPTDQAIEPLPDPAQTFGIKAVPFLGHSVCSNEDKLLWIEENKLALRLILQQYGTEYRRAQNPLYWITALSKRIHEDKPAIAVIADMRFKNEFWWIKESGGKTINVVRIGMEIVRAPHSSETDLGGAPYDYELSVVDGRVDLVRSGAIGLVEKILKERVK